jgi:hypothetical protein
VGRQERGAAPRCWPAPPPTTPFPSPPSLPPCPLALLVLAAPGRRQRPATAWCRAAACCCRAAAPLARALPVPRLAHLGCGPRMSEQGAQRARRVGLGCSQAVSAAPRRRAGLPLCWSLQCSTHHAPPPHPPCLPPSPSAGQLHDGPGDPGDGGQQDRGGVPPQLLHGGRPGGWAPAATGILGAAPAAKSAAPPPVPPPLPPPSPPLPRCAGGRPPWPPGGAHVAGRISAPCAWRACSGPLAPGPWPLAPGPWPLAPGCLAPHRWHQLGPAF